MTRLAGFAVTVVVALVVLAGCGSGPGGGGDDRAVPETATAASEDPSVASSGDRAQLQEAIDDVQDGIRDESGWDVCQEVSDGLERSIVRSAGIDTGCWGAVKVLLRRAASAVERTRSTVTSVEVRRPAALARVRDDDGRSYSVRFVWQDGAWKLRRLDFAAPSGLAAEQPETAG